MEDLLLNELYLLIIKENNNKLTYEEKRRYMEIIAYCQNNNILIPFGVEY